MPSTWNGSATSYATPADVLNYYDIRTVADFISDMGVRIGGSPNPTPATVEASPILQKMLDYGAGQIESAVLRSVHYTVDDLNALDGVSLELLIGINCHLAMGRLWLRRPRKESAPYGYEEALKYLDDLANGEKVFSLAEQESASLPSSHVETPWEICQRGMTAQQAMRYFGRTADLTWGPYGGYGYCGGWDPFW